MKASCPTSNSLVPAPGTISDVFHCVVGGARLHHRVGFGLSLYANTALSPHGNAIEHVNMYLPPEPALSPYWPPAWEESADNTFLRSVSSASF